jgi:hypothetical protein
MAFALVAAAPLSSEADDSGLIILSQKQVFGSLTRTPVRFPHEKHQAIEGATCLDCHHDWKDGKNVLDLGDLMSGGSSALCASCHRSPGKLQASFHLLCIGCHDGAKVRGNPDAPRACGDCHPWK